MKKDITIILSREKNRRKKDVVVRNFIALIYIYVIVIRKYFIVLSIFFSREC